MQAEAGDVVIIGAGSAGCLLAARLSEDPRRRVILVEAGPRDTNPWITLPVGFSRLLHDPAVNWCFRTEPQVELNGRAIDWPRGRVLGGSSAINGMIWVRGDPRDYDIWAAATGDEGWGWDQVAPLFAALENAPADSGRRLGRDGPVALGWPPHKHALATAFKAAGGECGHARLIDLAQTDAPGVGDYLITARAGRRLSAASAFLKPALKRPNLRLMTDMRVLRIELDDNRRARSVHLRRADGSPLRLDAAGGIILSAGVVGSPHLLMLSGIGPGVHLAAHGIATHVDRPAVGANLQDHFGVRIIARVNAPITINDDFRRPWRLAGHALRYALTRQGPLAIGGAYSGGFIESGAGEGGPDLQLHFLPLSTERRGWSFHDFSGITANVCQMRPFSRGAIRLAQADPLAAPAIDPAYLSDARDRDILTAGIGKARAIFGAPAFAHRCGAVEMRPGADVRTPEEVLAFARATGSTVFHPCGTCRMGADADSVVDSRLRVRGVESLFVIDASVMPTIPSGNINAATLMVAERGAVFVRAALARSADHAGA